MKEKLDTDKVASKVVPIVMGISVSIWGFTGSFMNGFIAFIILFIVTPLILTVYYSMLGKK